MTTSEYSPLSPRMSLVFQRSDSSDDGEDGREEISSSNGRGGLHVVEWPQSASDVLGGTNSTGLRRRRKNRNNSGCGPNSKINNGGITVEEDEKKDDVVSIPGGKELFCDSQSEFDTTSETEDDSSSSNENCSSSTTTSPTVITTPPPALDGEDVSSTDVTSTLNEVCANLREEEKRTTAEEEEAAAVAGEGSSSEGRLRRGMTARAPPSTPCDPTRSYKKAAAAEEEEQVLSKKRHTESFLAFRLQYLIVHVAIMLADGLQGTHLYVLYEGYGYSVASLYCLGFVSGALTSPFIGPIVDKIGRKNSAVLYCILEIAINLLEQYDVLAGLIISRVVGGITTNLLFSVFEAWLVTEHRRRGFSEDKLETIMRDSVVTSNISAIASGYLAHVLATHLGPVGPFEGAVGCTFVALLLVFTKWEENYGSGDEIKTVHTYMKEAFHTITSDRKIMTIGLIQGLSDGTLQTFVFLWSPALRHFTTKIPSMDDYTSIWGLDGEGEPAYGLIFGAFMACGVLGGLSAPTVRRVVALLMSSPKNDESSKTTNDKPVGVELLASLSYACSAVLLATPLLVDQDSPLAFSISLAAFLAYEFLIGLYMPCEGVIRSIYMPNDSICSLMTMLRVIINVLVAAGVYSTNFITFSSAFAAGSMSLSLAAVLQLSLIDADQWMNLIRNATRVLKVIPGMNTTPKESSIVLKKSSSSDIMDDSDIPIPPPLIRASPASSLCSNYTVDESTSDDNMLDSLCPR